MQRFSSRKFIREFLFVNTSRSLFGNSSRSFPEIFSKGSSVHSFYRASKHSSEFFTQKSHRSSFVSVFFESTFYSFPKNLRELPEKNSLEIPLANHLEILQSTLLRAFSQKMLRDIFEKCLVEMFPGILKKIQKLFQFFSMFFRKFIKLFPLKVYQIFFKFS